MGAPLGGSILIIALWMLLLLAIMAVTVSGVVRQKAVFIQRLDEIERLRLIAEAGIKRTIVFLDKERAGNPTGIIGAAWQGCSSFQDIAVGGGFFSSGIVDEERKININKADMATMKELFRRALDCDELQAQALAAAIIDWRDADSVEAIPSGSAENTYYTSLPSPYKAHDADFDTLDELGLVRGFTSCIIKKLQAYITIYTDGRVNVNTAPAVVLAALGIPQMTIDKILAFRAGPDRVEGTGDDMFFPDTALISSLLQQSYPMGADEIKALDAIIGEHLDVTPHNFFITAQARLANRKNVKNTSCVYNVELRQILYWKE